MTHSSCKKWHTLFFVTLLMLKMIHSVVWHALDTRNDTLCFYDTLLMLKMTHSVLWHTLDTRNDTVCFFSVVLYVIHPLITGVANPWKLGSSNRFVIFFFIRCPFHIPTLLISTLFCLSSFVSLTHFNSCCFNTQVLGTTLVQEFHMFYCHIECELNSRSSDAERC